jgi:hypothetical protein
MAQFPNNLEGDWSGVWNNNNPLEDRGDVRAAIVQATAGGNRDFLFNDGPGDYNPEFKLKGWIANPQALNIRRPDVLENAGINIQFPAINGNWYVMIVEEATTENDLTILELGSEPVSIDSVFRCPLQPTSAMSVSVSARTSAPLGAGEQLWLHYSTDSFATSTFVQMTGTPLSATLPTQADGTSVQYYLLTTHSGITLNAADVDYQSLRVQYQGLVGTYFTYTVSDQDGSLTPCDTFPEAEFCGDGIDNDNDGLVDGLDSECGLCVGNVGDNIFVGGDFGTVASEGLNLTQPDPNANPGVSLGPALPANVTTYTHGLSSDFACLGGVNCFPSDGGYVICTSSKGMLNPPSTSSSWIEIEDNGPEPDGYMMLINAAPSAGIFYRTEVSGLCRNTSYQFSMDVVNLLLPGLTGQLAPNIDFLIAPAGATLADLQNYPASFSTGDVPQDSAWHTYGFTFTTTNDTAITLALSNNNPGGMMNLGNDLAIDNISFRPCGPDVSLLANSSLCPGNTINLDATLSLGYNNPQYQWQYSGDGGQSWANISGATGEDFTFVSSSPSDSGQYRLLVSEMGNITDSLCRIVSDPLHVPLDCPLEAWASGVSSAQPEGGQRVFLYPNPSSGQVELRFEASPGEKLQLELYNMLGQQLWQQKLSVEQAGWQQTTLDFGTLASGMYGFRMRSLLTGEMHWLRLKIRP